MPRRRWTPFVEHTAEATLACLVTMTQANLLLVTTGHWIVAAQTGVVAGTASAAVLLLAKAHRQWVVSLTLATLTALVDYLVHPGAFGPVFLEAVVTGVAAGALSYGVGWTVRRARRRSLPAGRATAGRSPDPTDLT